MSDDIKLTLVQQRTKEGEPKVIFDLQATWYDMADWEANKVSRDIVSALVDKAVEWDKALTGGPPTG